jgi:3-oxoacyl-[acyl-carrier-protein] synthase-3
MTATAPAFPDVGIAGLGSYIPPGRHTAAHIAKASGLPEDVVTDKLGLRSKAVAGPEDGTIAMGVKAARAALKDAGVSGTDLDLILWVGEEHKERPMQTACIKVQKELGNAKAWGFDMSLRCGTAIAGLHVARTLMAADPRLRTALVVSGYRNADLVDYGNPRSRFMYNLAAGGAAAVLRKGLGRNRLLACAIQTDGSFSDDVYVPAGGTVEPLTTAGLAQRRNFLDVADPDGMKQRLDAHSMERFLAVAKQALAESGKSPSDLGYLALLHMKPSAHRQVLSSLGLSDRQSTYMDDVGHMGQNDPLVSLDLARRDGRVKDGTTALLLAAGIGYVWDAIAVQWGPA